MNGVLYHQNVWDLLGLEPWVSEAALRLIEKSERRCGHRLPSSVREWYATEGVVPLKQLESALSDDFGGLWHKYSNGDHPCPLPAVLEAFERVSNTGFQGDRFVDVVVADQECGYCFFEVDGSDDPPAWSEDYRREAADRRRVGDTFSDFLFGWFHDNAIVGPESHRPFPNGLWLRSPRDEALLPPHVDHFIDTMEERPHLQKPGGVVQYHFGLPGARLRITTDDCRTADGRSAWWLDADSPEALADLARRVWHVGGLAKTLRCEAEVGQAVLRALRGG
jgi:hypothetical protein